MKKLLALLQSGIILACITSTLFIGACSSLPHAPDTEKQVISPQTVTSLPPIPHRADFATGITFPQWGTTGYSEQDTDWQKGLQEIKQIHARWIAMTLPLHMEGLQSTQVLTREDTPTPQAFGEGIKQAHRLGFSVFVTPLITVDSIDKWAGDVSFSSDAQFQAWFTNYWNTLQPYLSAMSQEHVEMFSIGNEYDRLEDESSLLWQQLIQKVRSVFTGKVVYNRNWASFKKPLPLWLDSLDTIGCSTYFSVIPTPQRLSEQQALDLWKTNVQSKLDHIAQQIGKPVFVSEIGYRSGATAGYRPYLGESQEPQDDEEQTILYNAAMQNLSTDQSVSGVFWWAWSLPPFAPNGKAAAHLLARWFLYL